MSWRMVEKVVLRVVVTALLVVVPMLEARLREVAAACGVPMAQGLLP